MNEEILDVLIVGSGISGIGAGAHLSMKCPKDQDAAEAIQIPA